MYSFYQKQHGLVYANCICSEMGDAITNRKKKIEVTLFHSSVKNTLLIDNKDVFSQQTEFGEESKCH